MSTQQQPTVPTAEPGTALQGVTQVVAEPLRFKAKLAIGENAYASLRMINRTREIWDVLGAAGAGAALAKAGALGLGAAATPVGWVAVAALASGGACYGLYRWLGDTKGSRVIEIPKFLNTPLDTLGLALFDLIAPLALRLAAVDGRIESAERQALVQHLVDDWGLDEGFVTQAIEKIEPGVMQGSVEEMAAELSAFLHANPDCNHKAIATDLGQFLRKLLEAGGPLSEAEEVALAASLARLLEEPDGPLAKAWLAARSGAGKAAEQLGSTAKDAAGWARERLPKTEELQAAAGTAASKAWLGARSGAEQLGSTAKEAADWTRERLPTPEQLQAMTSTAATQVQQTVQKAASWAQDKLPAPEQVEGAAKRTLDLAKAGIERIKRRPGR
ncbi:MULTISPECIES: TerB family tellurite resistance protein [unclassified Roseateles]|uniref:tellurite resistance TerB family protein n=1 Tax=unclassified Roseateles TaxID=2626991 RepID=UPI0009EC3C77|nr:MULTISPECIES: TerB family tellurite resistance protein [unclassified Roseateles]